MEDEAVVPKTYDTLQEVKDAQARGEEHILLGPNLQKQMKQARVFALEEKRAAGIKRHRRRKDRLAKQSRRKNR